MNYFNELTELDCIDTVHLGDKATAQVDDFVNYVRPLLPDIKKGDAAKAKVAEYYLEHKDEYTEGCKNVLDMFMSQIGVSDSYVRQLKKATEFKEGIQNPTAKKFVDEHPTSIQYHLSKIPHEELMSKMLTGEHFTFREASNLGKVKRLTNEEVNQPTEETKTAYQIQQERYVEMVEGDEKQLIRTNGAAACYMAGTRKDVLAAAAQVLYDIKYQDPNLEKIIEVIKTLSQKALEKKPFVPKKLSEV